MKAKYEVKYENLVSNYYQEYEKEIHDYIIKNFEKGVLILELGCGRCNLLELLDKDYNVTGIENNFPLVNCGREKGLTIFNRDIEKDLGNFHGLYDIILILQVLEHLEQPLKVLEDCKKLLKTHGKVIISVPNVHFLTRIINTSLAGDEYLSGHINAYDRTQLKTVAEFSNYKIDKMFFSGDVFPCMKNFGKILNKLFRNLKIFKRFSRRIICIISSKD